MFFRITNATLNTQIAQILNDLTFVNKFKYFELRLVTDELDNDGFAEFLCVSSNLNFLILKVFILFRKIFYHREI